MKIEEWIKKMVQQQVKLLRKIKHTETQQSEKITKKQLQTILTIQMEEINQKILAKEGRLKRYLGKQYKQHRTFQNNCYGTYLTDYNELFLLLWIPGEYSSRSWVNSSLTLWQSDWCSTLFYLCCFYTFVQYTCFM